MKLYLSSYRVGDHAHRLRELVTRPGPAAIITNAADVFDDRLLHLHRDAADLSALGLDSEELDLRRYFGATSALRSRLQQFALAWVMGGSAFALARAMTACGFAEASRELVDSGALVYAGYSAGIDLMDDPAAEPPGYPASASPQTLSWVPWRIVPHWRSDHPEAEAADRAVARLSAAGLPYRALSDGEVIIVDGDVS